MSTTHGIYTSMYIYLQRQSHSHPIHAWLRTLRTPVRKLHTLMRKCLLPQHSHNSTVRPASPRPLRRAIRRQSLACHGDATSSPSPWLQLELYTRAALYYRQSCFPMVIFICLFIYFWIYEWANLYVSKQIARQHSSRWTSMRVYTQWTHNFLPPPEGTVHPRSRGGDGSCK